MGLCEIFAEVDALHCEALPHVFQKPPGPARTRAYIRRLLQSVGVLADEDAMIFVAQSGDDVVGLVKASIREAPDYSIMVPRRYAEIGTLAVKEGFRRSGVGRALMEEIHRWARDRGASQARLDQSALTVWEFNQAARVFYETLGYRMSSRRMWIALELE